MNLSTWSIKNPIPAVMVSAALSDAAPAQLESEVARKRENAIAPVPGLKHLRASVQDGVGSLTAEFRLEKPMQEAVDDVHSAVQGIRADLPVKLQEPMTSKLNVSGTPILAYTLRSSVMDDGELSWFFDNTLSRRLLGVKGVGSVTREGVESLSRLELSKTFKQWRARRPELFVQRVDEQSGLDTTGYGR